MWIPEPSRAPRARWRWPVLLGLALGLIECLALARSGLADRLLRR
jgi:hypothetical protein